MFRLQLNLIGIWLHSCALIMLHSMKSLSLGSEATEVQWSSDDRRLWKNHLDYDWHVRCHSRKVSLLPVNREQHNLRLKTFPMLRTADYPCIVHFTTELLRCTFYPILTQVLQYRSSPRALRMREGPGVVGDAVTMLSNNNSSATFLTT